MRILRLLNKKFLLIFTSLFLIFNVSKSNEPVDIWNLEKKNNESKKTDTKDITPNKNSNTIISNNLENVSSEIISEANDLNLNKNYLVGLYDPAENDLTINMWEFSDGEKILKIIKKIQKLNLSNDAKEIYSKLLLTNSLPPKKNLTNEQFIKIKVDWLIKNNNLELIKEFLIKNDHSIIDSELLKFYLDQKLSMADLESACSIFSLLKNLPKDSYISKYKIYCLINNKENEIAQLQYDLLKESGFKDIFFENKFNFLMGYNKKIFLKISEKNLLEFHLSHLTVSNFEYEPKATTDKIIWKYLYSNNLLTKVSDIDLDDREKIKSIEKATHSGNYKEKDLLDLYTRFQFNIYQLISVLDSYKLLPEYEARALLYQAYLISNEIPTKIKLLQILKEEFDKNNLSNAFNSELIIILENLNDEEIPAEYIEFYNIQLEGKKNINKKVKFNNKIIHQSKLINYFSNNIGIDKAGKDLEKKLKKIKKNKKNKKYYFSTKDIILIESLLYDGLKIDDKYKSLLELNRSNIPTDIEVMINDGEIAMILLRLVEIIGEDKLQDLGTETLYFIISVFNKLNIDKMRNNIILKVIPLKA